MEFHMYTKNEKLLSITQNVNKFAEKLLQLMADESPQGAKRLVALINRAKKSYNKPVDSALTGWFYGQFRKRAAEVDATAKGIETLDTLETKPNTYGRLKEFQALIGKGKWNDDSSYNYYLFVELIKSVPGYIPLKRNQYLDVINTLKECLVTLIDSFLHEYDISLRLSQNNKDTTHPKPLAPKEDIVKITSDLSNAILLAKAEPKNTIFFLVLEQGKWHFSWVDNMGQDYSLALNKELKDFLQKHQVNVLLDLNPIYFRQLKNICVKIKDNFLAPLLINPEQVKEVLNEACLFDKGVKSTFILQGKPSAYQLFWVNGLGQAREIALDVYPQLKACLESDKESNSQYLSQLRAQLWQVSIRQTVGMNDFKKVLSEQLGLSVAPVVIKPVIAPPSRLDMSSYSNIERCLGKKPVLVKAVPDTNKEDKMEAPLRVGRLKLSEYSAVSSLFSHKSKGNADKSHNCELEAGLRI